MIHTFTLACKVDYSVIDYHTFTNALFAVSHNKVNVSYNASSKKVAKTNNVQKLVFNNNNLSGVLTKEEMESMPSVSYEHHVHMYNGVQTGMDDYIVIEINYQKSLANKKYYATPITYMNYAILQGIMDLVCKAIPALKELNVLRTDFTRKLTQLYSYIYQQPCNLSEVELYTIMASQTDIYAQQFLHQFFTDDEINCLASSTIKDTVKLSIINKELSLLNVFQVRRIDYTLDMLTDYKSLYLDLVGKGRIPSHLEKNYRQYWGYDKNGTYISHSNHSKSHSVGINFYDKEKEMKDTGQSVLQEDKAVIHDLLRLEIQIKRKRLNYLIKKPNSTVTERLLKDIADANVEAQELNYYLSKIIGQGQYFTYPNAIDIINQSSFRANKKQGLCNVIKNVAKYHGISKFLDKVKDGTIKDCGKLSTAKTYIKELEKMGINPVTISRKQEKEMKKIVPTYQISNLGSYVHGRDYLLNPLMYMDIQKMMDTITSNELMDENSDLVNSISEIMNQRDNP